MGEIKNKEGEAIAYFRDEKDYHGEPGAFDGRRKDLRTPAVLRFPSTTDDLLEYGHDFFKGCLKIAESRNKRYAKANDPFRNFRLGGEFGIAVRISDKVSRLMTLTEPGNTVSDAGESIEDTCRDLANYAMLLSAMRSNERGEV